MQEFSEKKKPFWSGDRYLPNAVGGYIKAAGDSFLTSARRVGGIKFPRRSPPSSGLQKQEVKGLSDLDTGTFVGPDGTVWITESSTGLYTSGKKKLTLAQATKDGFKSSTWVSICVRKWMSWISSVPFVVQREKKPGLWEFIFDHPLNNLFKNPNPYISGQNFFETLPAHKWLCGNTFIHKARDAQKNLTFLFVLRPDYMTPVLNKDGRLSGWNYNLDPHKRKKPEFFKREEIIHIQFIDPVDPNWGCSPLLAGAKVVDTDIAAVDYNKSALENQGSPSGLLALDMDIDAKDFELAKGFAKSQIEGGKNAKRVVILGSKANYTPFIMPPEQMAYVEGRSKGAIEICALLNVQPPMAGIYDIANYKVEMARVIQWMDGIVPELNDYADALTFGLADELDEGYRVWYDTTGVQALLLALGDLMVIAKQMADAGYTLDIINRRLGLNMPAIPGVTNVSFMPANLQLVSFEGLTFDDEDDSDDA